MANYWKPSSGRFWRDVAVGTSVECWPWLGRVNPARKGHGRGGYGKIGAHMAHRIAFELAYGAIPPGLTVDHLCGNPGCQNPAHMEAVTLSENILRGTSFSAKNKTKTHCLNGHPFNKANTYVFGRRRCCRACNAIAAATAYYARKGGTSA